MNVLVLGDIILDTNYFCETFRKAPEADIPVYNVIKTEHILGGSANVARNLKNMGLNVEIISVIGNDIPGEIIKNLVDTYDITRRIYIDETRKSVHKSRIFHSNKLVTRYDNEDVQDISDAIEKRVLNRVSEREKVGAIVLSDYNKGFLTMSLCKKIIEYANQKKIPTFVDPKIANVEKYRHCFCFKPNQMEGELISGKRATEDILKTIKEKIHCEHVVLTSGDKGIFIDGSENHITHAQKIEVVDVTGCGDVVLAVLVYVFLVSGGNLIKAGKIANYIAGKSTQVVGNYLASSSDIEEYIDEKVIYDTEESKIRALSTTGKKLVFTNGCFDIIHSAHLRLLRYAKMQGDVLVVGINSDESVKRLKGDLRPINGIQERCELLKNLGFVDYIIVFDQDTPFQIVSILRPDIIVKGGDYKKEDIVGGEFARDVMIYNYIPNLSTSLVVKRIKDDPLL